MVAAISFVRNAIDQSFPPKARFSVEDIPDLTGQIAIVTGANSGVGKETAKALLNHNAKVYVAARDKKRAEQAIKELQEMTGKESTFLQLDLSDLQSVKRAAEEFRRQETQLHMLFNNAGVMAPPVGQLTKQGYDLQFGTNVLGHWYFTKLLLPTLLSTARATNGKSGRVIHTASGAADLASGLKLEILQDHPKRKKFSTEKLYEQSKLGNIIISNEFARRYGKEGLVSCSLNPGNLQSELQRHLGPVTKAVVSLILHPTAQGALTQLWAGTTEEGVNMNGKYLIPWARYGSPNPVAQDENLGKELWAWLEEQVKAV
ncbi:hypothetical protein DFP72DRAFT_1113173 [Ephemerocybe angulata]|uniref:NAD(P)-binding protein n=1 Tax=Ephemerocybe angulata TaxID=980116 RepID=A0A8H6I3H4_9AGAR|nr:hypothetical protein DFP72DRAFT_1113173 [Tulosesus angulatus]